MTEPKTPIWKAWNEERQHYREYQTQGFDADLLTLRAHIAALRKCAPLDKAGWPDWRASQVIQQLENDLSIAKTWSGTMP